MHLAARAVLSTSVGRHGSSITAVAALGPNEWMFAGFVIRRSLFVAGTIDKTCVVRNGRQKSIDKSTLVQALEPSSPRASPSRAPRRESIAARDTATSSVRRNPVLVAEHSYLMLEEKPDR